MKKNFVIPIMLMLIVIAFGNISFASPLPFNDIHVIRRVEYENEIIMVGIIIGGILALIPIIKMLIYNKKKSNSEEKLSGKFIFKCCLFSVIWPFISWFSFIFLSIIGVIIVILIFCFIKIKEEDILLKRSKYYFTTDLLFFNVLSYFMYFFPTKIIDVINNYFYYNDFNDISVDRLIFYIISIICMLIPVIIAKFKIKKFNKTIFDSEEKKMKLTRSYRSFLRIFTILSGIGLAVKTMGAWLTELGKPIIYLYPEKEEKIKVKLGKKEKLTCTYPKYEDEWNIIAKPNGDLTDVKTGRNFYALYWEGINSEKCEFNEGFCIKGEDIAKFLEEKLAILGLNEREANEFIVYWLPKLESNKYNLIKFIGSEKMNEYMPLEITPTPNTVIRVMMQFKGVRNYKEIKEQELYTPERKGFTVVEWGATEVK